MTMPHSSPPSRALQTLKTILYILAGFVLALGLVTGLSLVTGAANMVANLVLPLQLMGAEVASNLVAPMLTGLFTNLGILTLVLSFVLSALLYALGRLTGHMAALEARIAQVEANRWIAKMWGLLTLGQAGQLVQHEGALLRWEDRA
jgi:hypothetical protein